MKLSRISSIDQFRGFAVLTMVLANYLGGVTIVPAWLKHSNDIGFTFIDLIAPLFIFAICLTFGLSFQQRMKREGPLRTSNQFFVRYLAIVGMGALISAGEMVMGENSSGINWGVLQTIGMAGLLTLVVIRLRTVYRLIIGAGILIIYQVILDNFLLDLTIRSPHGGLYGSLNWGAMLILGTGLADLFHSEGKWKKAFPWASTAILAAGIALGFLLPVSKHRVSSSYVLICLGASALIFHIFNWLSERFNWKGRFFAAWGKNPLVLYFLHYVIIGVFFMPGLPALYQAAPPWLVVLEAAVLVGGVSAAAFWLDQKKIIISL